jgi:hypothetical protein
MIHKMKHYFLPILIFLASLFFLCKLLCKYFLYVSLISHIILLLDSTYRCVENDDRAT